MQQEQGGDFGPAIDKMQVLAHAPAILGIKSPDPPDMIKKHYRKLVLTKHPDKGGDVREFQDIQRAYQTLCWLQTWREERGEPAPAPEPAPAAPAAPAAPPVPPVPAPAPAPAAPATPLAPQPSVSVSPERDRNELLAKSAVISGPGPGSYSPHQHKHQHRHSIVVSAPSIAQPPATTMPILASVPAPAPAPSLPLTDVTDAKGKKNEECWSSQEITSLMAALERFPATLGKRKRFFHVKRAVGNGKSSNECYKYWKRHLSTVGKLSV